MPCRPQREIQANTPPWPEDGPFDLAVIDLPLRWIEKGEAKSPPHFLAAIIMTPSQGGTWRVRERMPRLLRCAE
jgi:hypothetical protein